MGAGDDFSRVPKIILAQQQAQQLAEQENASQEQPYLTIEEPEGTESPILRQHWTELSTITERTEITERAERMTERSPAWQSQMLLTPSRRGRGGADSSRTTSYGEELPDDSQTQRFFANIMDEGTPRQRPVSLDTSVVPSIRMSSATTTNSSNTSSKEAHPQEKPLPDRPLSIASKKSKLASLASSRLSIAASSLPGSSRDDGTELSGSIKTFPALRPSLSELAPSTVSPSLHSKSPTASSASSVSAQDAPSQGTGVSEMTAQVQKAIQAALQLEAMDKSVTPSENPKLTLAQPQSPPPAKGIPLRSLRSVRSTPQQSPKLSLQFQPASEGFRSPSPSTPKAAPPVTTPKSLAPSLTPTAETPRDPTSPAKPKSKLALLAQQKVSANQAPKLPAPKTEYLVPTANGATATTAITTSYQSLFSLTDPKRPAFIPKLDVAPLPTAAATQVKRTSKLAMKVKKVGEKSTVRTPVEEPEEPTASLSPIFQDTSRSRASPSAFASVLMRDDLMLFKPIRRSKSERRSGSGGFESRPTSHVRKSEAIVSNLTPPSAFAFDSPSPDDIVFNARRGTALAQSKHMRSAATSTLSSKS